MEIVQRVKILLGKIIFVPLTELKAWVECLVMTLPGRIGLWARQRWFAAFARSVGQGLIVQRNAVVTGIGNMVLGNNVRIGPNSYLFAHDSELRIGNNVSLNANVMLAPADGGTLVIGDNCMIGPGTVVRAANHNFDSLETPMIEQGHVSETIELAEDVWVAANCVILPGVFIGKGAIVGAGAVVTKNVAPYSIVGGVPARQIRQRNGTPSR